LRNPTQVEAGWPGGQLGAGDQKVPTTLIYSPNGPVFTWGFGCDREAMTPAQTYCCNFKTYLDQDSLTTARGYQLQTPGSVSQAKRWITDYLRQIYMHIKGSMERSGQGWIGRRIEFLFSVPTTWTNQAIIQNFRSAIEDAGFGSEESHIATVDLTEAESAAVHIMKGGQIRFNEGNIILVCDAGGGTTDLGLFEVENSYYGGRPGLRQ
jgi:hypothetical protein